MRRGEISDEIFHVKHKFPTKVIIFEGISYEFKRSLVAVKSRSGDAIAHGHEFVDAYGVITWVNGRNHMKQWA
jgi:hypothetical protein